MKKSENLEDLEGITLLTRYTMALLLDGGEPFLPALRRELLRRLKKLQRLEAVGTGWVQ